MVKFNTVSIAAGVTRGTWDERPKVGVDTVVSDASDGDYFQVEGGAVYRYSDDIGEWVRPFVYAGTPVLDIRIRGSVLPTAESPAWHSLGPDGVDSFMTTDGTHLSHGVGGSGFSKGVLHYNHGQVQKTHFFQGYIEQTTPDYHTGLAIKDGVKIGWIKMGARSDTKRMFVPTLAPNGGGNREERIYRNVMTTTAGEVSDRYLEFYLAASGSTKGFMAYVDHEMSPSIVCDYEQLVDHGEYSDEIDNSTHIAASASIYYIGQNNARNQIRTMKMKECFFGRY